MKNIMKLILFIILSIVLKSQCFADHPSVQRRLNAQEALKATEILINQSNGKIAAIENSPISQEEVEQIRQKHELEINKLIDGHTANLIQKDDEILQLQIKIAMATENIRCRNIFPSDHEMYGDFFAQLALEEVFSKSMQIARSAQAVLMEDELFWQYLYVNFKEFKALVKTQNQDKILKFLQNKANFFVHRQRTKLVDSLGNKGLSHIKESVVLDQDYYEQKTAVSPTLFPGENFEYLELHIAPANKEGISYNRFKKFDSTLLKGVLLINSEKEGKLKKGFSSPNENLQYSLTEKHEADCIVIDIIDSDPLAGTHLQGLIEIVGKEAQLQIHSTPGIGINGAFFSNIKDLYIRSLDSTNFNTCASYPCARNIRIGSLGMHANSTVTFNSKHVVVDGPIWVPQLSLFWEVQGSCIFTTKGKIEQLGLFSAKCDESFSNNGNIKIQGPAYLTTNNFTNEALWHWLDWSPAMISALDPELSRGYFIIDKWHKFPFDDIAGRRYEEMIPNSGIMAADFYRIKINNDGGFQNLNGAQIYAKAPSPAFSTIEANGQFLNMHKQAFNEGGYLKQGFDFVPSIINLGGNALFYSHTSQVLNSASTINVVGNCTVQGQNIVNTNAEGSFLDYICGRTHGRPKGAKVSTDVFKEKQCGMPGKGSTCLGNHGYPDINEIESVSHHYRNINTPAIFRVGKLNREGTQNINDRGSIVYSDEDSFDRAGKYKLEGRQIDPVSMAKAVQRFVNLNSQNGEPVALIEIIKNILAPITGNQPYGYLGLNYIIGKSKIEAKEGVDIIAGIIGSQNGTKIRTAGDFRMTGIANPYIVKEIHNKNQALVVHDFVMQPAILITNGGLDIEAANGKVYLKGAQILFGKNATIVANEFESKPLTVMAEDTSYVKKRDFLRKTAISTVESTSATIDTGVIGDGFLEIKANHFSDEGGVFKGKNGTKITSKTFDLNAHLVNHYRITNTKVSGIKVPGVGNILIDAINGDLASKSYKNNIGIYATLDNLLKTESASDMAPSILMVAEAYTMADKLAREYQTTGSGLAAMTNTALDQLGLTSLNVGVFKTKTREEKNWQEAYHSKIGENTVEVNIENANITGAQIGADQDLTFNITKNFMLNGQPVTSSSMFRQDGKSATVSISKNSVGVSGSVQTAKANREMIHHALPNIFAGNSVTMNIGEDAKIEGVIKAPKIKVIVSGKLLLKTVQDRGVGDSSQRSINAGVTFTANGGVMPNGGFQVGDGDWFRQWADQQAGIEGTEIEVKAKHLILEGARILGEIGVVEAETIDYENVQNIYESEFSSFGVDTNFVNFLMKPENTFKVLSHANAIKGMAVFGNEDEFASQTLKATISKNLKVNTNSNIDGLNRDDSKAEGPVHKSSHKFSLALPIVDWKELGEGLERIGITAREINQKRLNALRSIKMEASESQPKEAEQWKEVIEGQERISEIIEESNLSEEAKEELAQRIFLLFTPSGEYFVRSQSEANEQGTLTVSSSGNGPIDATYQPEEGMILTVDTPENYDEDTYTHIAEVLGKDAANDLRQTKSKWGKLCSFVYNLEKNFIISSLGSLGKLTGESAVVLELYIETLEDPETEELVMKAGAELAHNAYEKLVETWNNRQVQGGLKVAGGAAEIVIGDLIAGGIGLTGVGAIPGIILATAASAHGIDQIATGFSEMFLNEKIPTITSGALQELGLSPRVSEMIDVVFAMSIPFSGNFKFLNFAGKGVEAALSAGRRTSHVNIPMALQAETCPKVIGLTQRELNTVTNPLKVKQIPASTAIKLEEIRHLPPLRQEYIKEVWELKRTVNTLYKEGKTSEQVARTVSQMRREIGIKYKDITPSDLREIYYQDNIRVYGDPLGPTIEFFRKAGKSWEEIIESACKEHGRNLPGTK